MCVHLKFLGVSTSLSTYDHIGPLCIATHLLPKLIGYTLIDTRIFNPWQPLNSQHFQKQKILDSGGLDQKAFYQEAFKEFPLAACHHGSIQHHICSCSFHLQITLVRHCKGEGGNQMEQRNLT